MNSLGNSEIADSESEAVLMNRFLTLSGVFGLSLFLFPHNASAQTSIPVVHPEPITIHIVDGQDGRAIAHLHLVLVAGYDRHDVETHLWHEDVMTDDDGDLALPATLLNLPWLQLLLPKSSTCKADPHAQIFSVERMRNDGLSAPNRCGIVTAEDRPGRFTVFAQDREQAHNKGFTSGVTTAASIGVNGAAKSGSKTR